MQREPFLTILTRTHKRPAQLRVCSASIAEQKAAILIEQIVLRDERGVGVGDANRLFYTADAKGAYVWQLDDDDMMANQFALAELHEKLYATLAGKPLPPYFFVRFDHGDAVRPTDEVWGKGKPKLNQIGGSSILTRNDIWMKYRECWGLWYGGDYDFIFEVMQEAEPLWVDVVLGKAQHGASRGRMETE